MYSVPHGVCDDDLLTDGSSIVVSWRYVRRTDDKILCDDVYAANTIYCKKMIGKPGINVMVQFLVKQMS